MRTKNLTFFILFVSVVATETVGQSEDFYKRPKILNNPRLGVDLTAKHLEDRDKSSYWHVYAAYNTAPRSTPAGHVVPLRFMQKFKVRSHRFSGSELQLQIYDPLIRMDYGWVDATDLVLSEYGMIDVNSGFRLKYLPVTRIDDIDPSLIKEDGYSVAFYQEPRSNTTVNFTEKAFSGFWYLYKRIGNPNVGYWYLLGRSSKLNNGPKVDVKLVGWIRETQLLPWDQRLVLQPNQDEAAMEERLASGLVITAFYDSLDASRYASNPGNNQYSKTNVFSKSLQDAYNKKNLDSETIRWPILSNSTTIAESLDTSDPDVFKVGVKGRPSSTGKKVDFNQVELDSLSTIWAQQLEKSSEINIVFVIDATFSMGDHIIAVKDALQEVIKVFQRQKRFTYRMGAVLYTDESEGTEYAIRSTNQLLSFSGIEKWLANKREYHTDKNSTLTEGVYYGLLKGTELFNSAKETNFIVHIGDAAGNDFLKHKNELLQKLLQYDVSFISIQAHNPLSRITNRPLQSYQDYHLQIRDLISEHVSKQDLDLKRSTPKRIYQTYFASTINQPPLGYLRDTTKSAAEFSSYSTTVNKHPIQSLVQVSHPGHEVPWQMMSSFVRSTVLDIEINNDRLLNEVSISKGEGLGEMTFRASIVDQLQKAGFSPEDISLWLGRAYEALLEVFVPSKVNGATYPILEFALFIDQEELQDLRVNLLDLIDSDQNMSEIKDPTNPDGLPQTFKKILKLYVDDTEIQDYDNLQIATALRLMIGLSQEYESTFNAFLDESGIETTISNIRNLENSKVRKLVDGIDEIHSRLSPIKWEEHSFISYGGQKYYWIPQRALLLESIN